MRRAGADFAALVRRPPAPIEAGAGTAKRRSPAAAGSINIFFPDFLFLLFFFLAVDVVAVVVVVVVFTFSFHTFSCFFFAIRRFFFSSLLFVHHEKLLKPIIFKILVLIRFSLFVRFFFK